jgi:hypothetical protein
MKRTTQPHARRILLVDLLTRPSEALGHYPDVFQATVACLDGTDGTPRNWRRPYADQRVKADTGGFSISAFKSSDDRILPSFRAPEVHSDNPHEYLEVADALKAMDRRLERLRDLIGSPSGEIERMIRQIMALNVEAVWLRPRDGKTHPCNLTQGEWEIHSVGAFADILRDVFIHEPARLAAAAAIA